MKTPRGPTTAGFWGGGAIRDHETESGTPRRRFDPVFMTPSIQQIAQPRVRVAQAIQHRHIREVHQADLSGPCRRGA